jgi:hypothetical protein
MQARARLLFPPFALFLLLALHPCRGQEPASSGFQDFVSSLTESKNKSTVPLKNIRSKGQSSVFFAELTLWAQTHLEAPFLQRLPADAPWRDRAAAWMKEALPLWCSFRGGDPEITRETDQLERLFAEAAALEELGCIDPLLVSIHGGLFTRAKGKNSAGVHISRRAAQNIALMDPGPLASMIILAQPPSAQYGYDRNWYRNERTQLAVGMAKVLPAALQDPAWKDHEAILAFFLCDTRFHRIFSEHGSQVANLINDSTIPSWIKQLRQGCEAYAAASEIIDDGFAQSISPAKRKESSTLLNAAAGFLDQAWKDRPDRPEAAGLMVLASSKMGTHALPRMRTWLERAVTAEFDYMPAYTHYINSLHDFAEGTPQVREQFARECLETARYDTSVPYMANEVGVVHANSGNRKDLLFFNPAIASLMQEAYEAYVARARNDDERLLWRSFAALHAFHQNDFARALTHIKANEGRLHRRIGARAGFLSDSANHLPTRIEIAAGPDGPLLLQVETSLKNAQPRPALDTLEKLIAQHPGPGPAFDYLHSLASAAKAIAEFQSGVPATLPVESLGLPWAQLRGPWILDQPGDLIFNGADNSSQLLFPAAPGQDFELSLDYEHQSPGTPQFHIGLLLGRAEGPDKEGIMVIIRPSTEDEENRIVITTPYQASRRLIPFLGKVPAKGNCRFVVKGRSISIHLNGQTLTEHLDLGSTPTLPAGPLGQHRFGFGAYYGGSKVAYRNIRLAPVTPPN